MNCITNEDGSRFYEDELGRQFPSVTTVLQQYEPTYYLDAWRARVGEKEAAKITEAAIARGNTSHLEIEGIFESPNYDTSCLSPYTKTALNAFYKHVDLRDKEQAMLFEPEPGLLVAGRFDHLVYMHPQTFRYLTEREDEEPSYLDEGLYMVDLKTKDKSPMVNKVDFILKNLIQISTYTRMYENLYSNKCCGAILVYSIVLKTKTKSVVLYLDDEKITFYFNCFMSMLRHYHKMSAEFISWDAIKHTANLHYLDDLSDFSNHIPVEISLG